MKIKTVIHFLSVFFFLISCNDEKIIDLGQGYYYIPFQETTFDVTMFGGNGVFIYRDSSEVPVIYPEITDFSFNSNYIVVEQRFDFLETKILLTHILFNPGFFQYDNNFVLLEERYDKNSHHHLNSQLEKERYVNSIMHTDNKIIKMFNNKNNYFIIDKRRKRTIGPLTNKEFEYACKTMEIQLDMED